MKKNFVALLASGLAILSATVPVCAEDNSDRISAIVSEITSLQQEKNEIITHIETENVREYSFSDFLNICSDIGEKRKLLIENMTDEEKYGDSNDSLERQIHYEKLINDITDAILDDCPIKRGETVNVSGYVDDVVIRQNVQRVSRYDIQKRGITNLILKESDKDSEYESELQCRSFCDFSSLRENDKVVVQGIFLENGNINDMSFLYNCKIVGVENRVSTLMEENPYKEERDPYLYRIGQDIINSNFGTYMSYPDFTEEWSQIFINSNESMAEVGSYIIVTDENGNDSALKWDVEFSYSTQDNENYQYDTKYVLIEGYAPFGEYQIIE